MRHTHKAMPAARQSLFFLSTPCVVRSGACTGSPDSQFTLLAPEVKCNTCLGIRQFMSHKNHSCQEEQKARSEMLITAAAAALICELYPHGLKLQKYRGVPHTARRPLTVPMAQHHR